MGKAQLEIDRKMEYFIAQHRLSRLLLLFKQQSECLKSQIFRYATTISTSTTTTSTSKCVRDTERDSTKFNASEGHIANCTYQAPFARLVFSTAAAAATTLTDRPVCPHFIHYIKHIANHPPLTHNIRFYCTAKTIRKKMVS